MNCKDCKHFRREEEGSQFGVCANDKFKSDYKEMHVCKCPVDGLYASCDEQRGYFTIGELFGCIHFEKI